MTKKNTNANTETPVEAISKTESFIIRHKVKLIILLLLAAGAVIGYFIYSGNQEKKDTAAKEALITLEENAMTGIESASVLTADFEAYMSEHEGHVAGIAPFEAGVAAYNDGDYNKAIEFFGQYSSNDKIYTARAKACIGDCYANLGEYENSLKNYESAVEVNDGFFTSEYAFKAGLTAEKLGNNEKALSFYNLIKDEYPYSPRAQEIDKYIARIEAK